MTSDNSSSQRSPSGLPPTIEWVGDADGVLRLLDQTLLPHRVEFRECRAAADVWQAIRELCVRGAPAIGVAAAYGLCLATREHRRGDGRAFLDRVKKAGRYLESSRPTAVNLAWAVARLVGVAEASVEQSAEAVWDLMLVEADRIARADAEACRRMGEIGADLIPDGGGVLTHCNAGALATVAYGTALSLMYVAKERGKRFQVYADETRPLLQGARLTAFELAACGVDVTVICDGAAASLMSGGAVDLVVVGADRVAANGDAANKIGTYGVAVAARHHGIPLYVVAPRSTFDLTLASGDGIPIEQRDESEVRMVLDREAVAPGAKCLNPAFDVTPADLITGIVTEVGLITPVTAENVRRVVEGG